jgi:hypothetical protein
LINWLWIECEMNATGIFYCQIYSSLLPDRQPSYVIWLFLASAGVYLYGLFGSAGAYVGENNEGQG